MQSMLADALNTTWLALFPVRLLIAVTAIWLCAAIASSMFRSFSAALKHRLWAMSTGAVLLTPALLLVMPEWRTGMIKSDGASPIVVASSVPSTTITTDGSHESIQRESIGTVDRPVGGRRHSLPIETEPVARGLPAHELRRVQPAIVSPNPAPPISHRIPWPTVILAAWSVPALLLIVRMLSSHIAAASLLRQSRQADSRWQNTLTRLCEHANTSRPRLVVHEKTPTPLCLGILRPTIVVPAGATNWDEPRIHAVLTHEMAHAARRDVLWQTLARLACAVYWFHPLSWMTQWRMRVEREIACDDSVIAGHQPASYARWLVDLAASFGASPQRCCIPTAAVAMANHSNLEHRVRAIMESGRRRSPVSRRAGIAIAAVAIVALALFSTLSPLSAHRANAAQQATDEKKPTTGPATVPPGMYRLFGKVTDAHGSPVPGAPLTILIGGRTAKSLRASADGSFEFTRETSKFNYDTVMASSVDGLQLGFAQAAQSDAQDQRNSREVNIVLKPARELQVNVCDENGVGVGGAWVGASSSYRTVGDVIADAQGKGTLRVPPDAPLMHVIAMKDGVGFDYLLFWAKGAQRTDPYRLEPDFNGVLNFKFGKVKQVTVVVVDDNQKPLRGVRIDPWLYRRPGKGAEVNLSGIVEVEKVTGTDGKATFDVPVDLERPTNFWTRLDGYCAPERAIYDPKKPAAEIRTQLLKLIPVQGYVRDSDGNAVADAKVRISGEGYQMDDFRSETVTEADGRFHVDVNPELYYGFCADKESLAAPMQFAMIHRKAPGKPIELKLEKTMPVRLKVTTGPDNAPAANASIAFYQREDGSYYKLPKEEQFPGPTLGRKWISPLITQSLKTGANGMLTVNATIPGDFSLYAYVNGQQPAVHFKINDRKTYSITEFTAPGRRAEKRIDIRNPDEGFQVEIHADAAAIANRMLKGRVVMRDNPSMSVSDIKVSFRSIGDLIQRDESVSNKQGEFTIRQDKVMQYLFGTSQDGKLRGIIAVKPENTTATLPVGPTASMHGRLLNEDGKPLAGKQIDWGFEVKELFGTFSTNFGSSTVTDAHGLFRFDGVVPGYEYKLSVVLEFGDEVMPRSWRLVATKLAPTAEDLDIGDVTLPKTVAYKPKTPDDYATEAFAKAGTITDRLKNAKEIAHLSYQQILVVLGSPDRPAAKKFFEYRHDMDQTDAWAALADYALVAANIDDAKYGAAAWASELNIDCKSPRVTFVVLDANGKYLTHATDQDLSIHDQLSRSKLIAFAKEHTLPKPDARKLLADALARAKAADKRVLVEHGGPYCSWCVKLGQYFEAHHEQLDKDYVIVTLDYRFTNGEDVITRLRAVEGGIPWMAILDDTGKVLITSDAPKTGNIGYPGEPGSRIYWEHMLRSTAHHMTEADIQALLDPLK
jgi:beta-lactamase regulating signal transducer with metallopeptidase domain